MRSRPGFVVPHLSAAFSPLDLSGLIGWWDASDTATITESSGAVSQWDDLSGNDYHLTNAVGGLQLKTGVLTIGGLNAISDNGGNGYIRNADVPLDETTSIYCVVRSTEAVGDRFLFNGSSGERPRADQTSTQWVVRLDGSHTATVSGHAVDADEVFGTLMNGSSTYLRCNGTSGSTTTCDAFSINGFLLGAQGWSTGAYRFYGAIGEVVISAALDTTNRDMLEAYLSAKWGI